MEEVKNSECCVAPGTSVRVTVPKRLDLCYYFGTFYTIHLYFDLNMSTDQDIERGSLLEGECHPYISMAKYTFLL